MVSLPHHLTSTPVGRDRLPRDVQAGYQRDRVLAVAVEVFAKRGYRGTTVDHIVSAARIGVGSFYALFDGKEDCFLAAYDRIVVEGRDRIAAAQPAGGGWAERTAAGLRTLLVMIAAAPFAARLALVEVQTAGATARYRHQRNLDEVAALIRIGREHSAVADELPATLEFAIVGGLTWLLQQRIADGATGDAAQLFPEMLEIVAEPYLGEAATRELATAS
jgi:AcrR family transcriptional regulator